MEFRIYLSDKPIFHFILKFYILFCILCKSLIIVSLSSITWWRGYRTCLHQRNHIQTERTHSTITSTVSLSSLLQSTVKLVLSIYDYLLVLFSSTLHDSLINTLYLHNYMYTFVIKLGFM